MPVSRFRFLAAAALAPLATTAWAAESPGMIHQGHLILENVPVTGVYDFRFSLHDNPTTGSQIDMTVEANGLAVKEGLYQAALDFGTGAFDGAPRWLEIAVRDGAFTGGFTMLSPRTALDRAPYAVHALKGDRATSAVFALQSGTTAWPTSPAAAPGPRSPIRRPKPASSPFPALWTRFSSFGGSTCQWKNPAAVGARDNAPLRGLVADEVEQVLPPWVSQGFDGLRRLHTTGFPALAIEAIWGSTTRSVVLEQQQLQNELQALHEENERLQELNESLSKRLDCLAELETRLGKLETLER